jgi:hypothetical protein
MRRHSAAGPFGSGAGAREVKKSDRLNRAHQSKVNPGRLSCRWPEAEAEEHAAARMAPSLSSPRTARCAQRERSEAAERGGAHAPAAGSFAQVSRSVDEHGEPVALKTVPWQHARSAAHAAACN